MRAACGWTRAWQHLRGARPVVPQLLPPIAGRRWRRCPPSAASMPTAPILPPLCSMASVGLVPTSQSTTSLLQCFARLGQHATALGVLDWMKRSGLDPGVHAYTALLTPPTHLSEAGAVALVAHAKTTYARLRDDGVPPNARFFTALLHCYGRGRDAGAVERAWVDLRATDGLRPDLILYSAMIDACAKVGGWAWCVRTSVPV